MGNDKTKGKTGNFSGDKQKVNVNNQAQKLPMPETELLKNQFSQRIDLPCGHFITLRTANSQAIKNPVSIPCPRACIGCIATYSFEDLCQISEKNAKENKNEQTAFGDCENHSLSNKDVKISGKDNVNHCNQTCNDYKLENKHYSENNRGSSRGGGQRFYSKEHYPNQRGWRGNSGSYGNTNGGGMHSMGSINNYGTEYSSSYKYNSSQENQERYSGKMNRRNRGRRNGGYSCSSRDNSEFYSNCNTGKYNHQIESGEKSKYDQDNYFPNNDDSIMNTNGRSNIDSSIGSVSDGNSAITQDKNDRPVAARRTMKYDGSVIDSKLESQNQIVHNEHSDYSQDRGKGAIQKSSDRMKHTITADNEFVRSFMDKTGQLKPSSSLIGDQLCIFCLDCVKMIHKDIARKHSSQGHRLSYDTKSLSLVVSEQNTDIDTMENGIKSKYDELKTSEIIIDASLKFLPEVNNILRKGNQHSASAEVEAGNILSQIQTLKVECAKISGDMQEVKNAVQTIQHMKLTVDSWNEKRNYTPQWLLLSWLKTSVALTLFDAESRGCQMVTVKSDTVPLSAKLTLQGDRMLLSSFRQNIYFTKDDSCIEFKLLESIFEKNASLAYMKITFDGDEVPGTIIIRINTETFAGKQFHLLCTGELGPCLLNTNFFRNCWRGKCGHHIWGGDYSSNNGDGGKAILQHDKGLIKVASSPIVAGLIAARYGYQDDSTIFRIYLQEADFVERFAFAQIEEGLHILQHISEKGDIVKATICDVGIVAELN